MENIAIHDVQSVNSTQIPPLHRVTFLFLNMFLSPDYRTIFKYLSSVLFVVYARVRLFAHSILPVCLKSKTEYFQDYVQIISQRCDNSTKPSANYNLYIRMLTCGIYKIWHRYMSWFQLVYNTRPRVECSLKSIHHKIEYI